MKAKLIKVVIGDEYRLDDENGVLIASSLYSSKNKLSLKNCQAIERGYDLDKWIAKKVNDFNIVDKAVEFSNANSKNNGAYLAYIVGAYEMAKQLELKQTEWDVEVETIEYGLGNDNDGRPVYETRCLLDADGCLILKRI